MEINDLVNLWLKYYNKQYEKYLYNQKEPRYYAKQFFLYTYIRSNSPIPKERLRDALKEIPKVEVKAPVKVGEVLIENVLGLEINIIASRDLISQ